MPVRLSVIDVHKDIKRAQAKLDRIARNKMQAELNKALRTATKDTRKVLKQAPLNALPRGGGGSKTPLNKWAARMPTIRIHLEGRTQGVHIRMSRRGHDLRSMNRGRLRRPVFYGAEAKAAGRKKVWVNQTVPSGWWEAATKKEGNHIVDQVTHVLGPAIEGEWRKP